MGVGGRPHEVACSSRENNPICTRISISHRPVRDLTQSLLLGMVGRKRPVSAQLTDEVVHCLFAHTSPIASAPCGCECRLFVDGSTKALPYRVRRNFVASTPLCGISRHRRWHITSPKVTPYDSNLAFRGRISQGTTDSSSTSRVRKYSVRVGSAASSPQIPTQMPALWAFSTVMRTSFNIAS